MSGISFLRKINTVASLPHVDFAADVKVQIIICNSKCFKSPTAEEVLLIGSNTRTKRKLYVAPGPADLLPPVVGQTRVAQFYAVCARPSRPPNSVRRSVAAQHFSIQKIECALCSTFARILANARRIGPLRDRVCFAHSARLRRTGRPSGAKARFARCNGKTHRLRIRRRCCVVCFGYKNEGSLTRFLELRR